MLDCLAETNERTSSPNEKPSNRWLGDADVGTTEYCCSAEKFDFTQVEVVDLEKIGNCSQKMLVHDIDDEFIDMIVDNA